MATIRTNDFALIFRGDEDFATTGIREVPAASFAIDTKPNEAAKKAKNSTRTLTCVQAGAAEDVDPAVDRLMDFIRKKTGGKLETIGTFCVVGMSNGCAIVLGLATALKEAGAPYLTYVGVTNVTIFPFGRKPPIKRVGALAPVNDPGVGTLDGLNMASNIPIRRINPWSSNYPHWGDTVPRVKLINDIDAKYKWCFYETQGNRVKLVSKSPLYGESYHWWWWADSSMAHGEVHGQVDGFQVKEFTVSGPDDFALHNACCQGEPFKQMLKEAGGALKEFPEMA
jgi:hypothetical protein